jgi:hypothetical protein
MVRVGEKEHVEEGVSVGEMEGETVSVVEHEKLVV